MNDEVSFSKKYDKTKGKTEWIYCPYCNIQTEHLIESSLSTYCNAPNGMFFENHEILSCQGCKNVTFISQSWEDYSIDDKLTKVYPERRFGLKRLNDLYNVPENIVRIYEETIKALSSNLPILAGVGMRAIIESVCAEKKATGNNLFKRIDDLVTQKVLTEDGAKILHSIRSMGNDAVHKIKAHDDYELSIAMEVVEHLLQSVYIIPEKASDLVKHRK